MTDEYDPVYLQVYEKIQHEFDETFSNMKLETDSDIVKYFSELMSFYHLRNPVNQFKEAWKKEDYYINSICVDGIEKFNEEMKNFDSSLKCQIICDGFALIQKRIKECGGEVDLKDIKIEQC